MLNGFITDLKFVSYLFHLVYNILFKLSLDTNEEKNLFFISRISFLFFFTNALVSSLSL